MHRVIDGDESTPPPKTVPGGGPSLGVSQLRRKVCVGFSWHAKAKKTRESKFSHIFCKVFS